ncbi:DUF3801 domain-containing protein [Aerococcus viridans]
MAHIEEDINEKIFSLALRGSAKAIPALYNAIKRIQMETDMNGLKLKSGEISETELQRLTDNLKTIDFSNNEKDLEEFNKVAQFYNVKYAIKEDLTDPDKSVMFFEAKNEERIAQCLRKFTDIHERLEEAELNGESTSVDTLLKEEANRDSDLDGTRDNIDADIDDSNVRTISELDERETNQDSLLQKVYSLSHEASERSLDGAYADSFEQSAQISEEVEGMKNQIYKLVKDNDLENNPNFEFNKLPHGVRYRLNEEKDRDSDEKESKGGKHKFKLISDKLDKYRNKEKSENKEKDKDKVKDRMVTKEMDIGDR